MAGIPVIVVQHDDPEGSTIAVGTAGWQLRPEIAHHNETLHGFDAGEHMVDVKASHAIAF